MDVVYILGFNRNNQELRFSLRSIDKNLAHDRVILSGYPPEWTTNTARLTVKSRAPSKKFLNAARNLLAACQWEGTSEEFILFNDDFFVIKPVDEIPMHHRGTLARAMEVHHKRWGANPYYKGMRATMQYLQAQGYDNPLAYHLHAPMVINKEIMEQVLIDTGVTNPAKKRPNYLLRTIYGNVAEVGGTRARDVKVASNKSSSFTSVMKREPSFLSTSDQSFRHGAVGRWIVGQFTQSCQYEKGGPKPKQSRRPNPQHPHRHR